MLKRIGVVGCGNISDIYLTNLTVMFNKQVEVTALTDLKPDRAEKASAKYNVHYIKNTSDLINSPQTDIILNITEPNSHYKVALETVNAGKHIYGEKPLCATREEALEVLKIAEKNKLLVGNAPDTFLGAGIQTCRKIIDEGQIGKPVAAVAFMVNHGHESWHPGPEFYYKNGGGPMFDMGPYYLTALITLMGPITRVSGSAKKSFDKRTITSEPLNGKVIDVDVPTHIAGVMDFASGAAGTIITSFDVYSHTLPCIEIYGSEGSLRVPDPNTFGGKVFISRFREEKWTEAPLLSNYSENSRGLGLADMADAISTGRSHRASGELAYHVLEVMHGFHDASASGTYYNVKSSCRQPEPMIQTG
ncbi:MAG: Gfo/Idh/MocA family oxidoreductase [Treponema sp.]|nr:Gfo/Idh/MocA family oxidoreductase [Treponema sp.]MCL2244385.1 Gfo/Idh/MocA family oxidoreductase [Treponema sp.]